MIKTVVMRGDKNRIKIVQLEMATEIHSLREILRSAALEYGRTKEGQTAFLNSGGISYETFFNSVSAEIYQKYGILKMHAIEPDIVADCYERLADSKDIASLAEHFSGISEKWNICSIAVRLAEMWGIMETLDGRDVLAECGTEQNVSRLISWAQEYVSGGGDDLTAFFKEKMEKKGEYHGDE